MPKCRASVIFTAIQGLPQCSQLPFGPERVIFINIEHAEPEFKPKKTEKQSAQNRMSIEPEHAIADPASGKKAIASALTGGDPCTQYGALCWRKSGDKIEVLLVTSRDTGRWIIPKGWPMKGKDPCETASLEAFEEAGVEGKISDNCAGLYSYTKVLGPDRSSGVPCVVAVYPIQVRKLLGDFPERDERRRKWFSTKKAAMKVDEPELRELLRGFSADKKAG